MDVTVLIGKDEEKLMEPDQTYMQGTSQVWVWAL